MKVLIACEYSGVVRDAFTASGHDATSCDILPTESAGDHYQGDVLDILDAGWDLMVAHPPCTFLTNAGVRWLYDARYPNRWRDMVDGAAFFRSLLEAPIARIAVENPIMHGWARKIVGRRQDQTIQPWMFGHPESKATGLWLKGLPPLIATEDVRGVMDSLPANERGRVHYASPGPDRWKERSTTLPGIAAAMAAQWGDHLTSERVA